MRRSVDRAWSAAIASFHELMSRLGGGTGVSIGSLTGGGGGNAITLGGAACAGATGGVAAGSDCALATRGPRRSGRKRKTLRMPSSLAQVEPGMHAKAPSWPRTLQDERTLATPR